ncbi:membrane lipoprotein lipid attachment site-containing protein [Paenibacillus sp. JDR-2]|uniref:membrane lipoprotein lipid attachment site-containing protein n=1 Tax=Paenibacillus sp. (strain JDR-2) TaxID=324057 RepID=UPI0005A1357D|nr:membrane lipoprotein lipid attachment site-containing protein [Paenibacillus sp. JDR-2]
MMKKMILAAAIVALLSGCGSNNGEHAQQVRYSIGDQEVMLKGLQDITLAGQQEENGLFKEISVSTSTVSKSFTWSNVINPAYYPAIEVADLNEDGDNEIIIVLTKGYGTGVNAQELHILNEDDLSELAVENPLHYIINHSHSSIQSIGDKVKVTVDIDGQTYNKDYAKSAAGAWNDKIGFGNVLNYAVMDNKLVALVPGNLSPAEYPVTIKLEYGKDLKVAKSTIIEQ